MSVRTRVAVGIAWLAGLLVACSGNGDPRPNVVLVSIDTLRADHLGVYGYERDTSPHLDALATESTVFDAAYAQSSWTLPSHVTLFTGLDPWAHGVTEKRGRMNEAHDTLAEWLRAAGYWTGAWVGRNASSFIGADRGFAQGFDEYAHAPHGARGRRLLPGRRPDQRVGRGQPQLDAVLRALARPLPEPFFLFVHLDDVHSQPTGVPYAAPAPYGDRFCPGALAGYSGCDGAGVCGTLRLQKIHEGALDPPTAEELEKFRCLYDGAVAFTDGLVGSLREGLESAGVYDDTLFIVTSDHGESLMEHGEFSHYTVYEEVARVPLLVRLPGGRRAGREDALVGLADIAPTVRDLVGLPPQPGLQGRSLSSLLLEGTPPAERPVFSLGLAKATPQMWRQGPLKYVWSPAALPPRRELYDLATDPAEADDLAARHPETVAHLHAELEAYRHRLRSDALPTTAGPAPGADEREKLRALGYGD